MRQQKIKIKKVSKKVLSLFVAIVFLAMILFSTISLTGCGNNFNESNPFSYLEVSEYKAVMSAINSAIKNSNQREKFQLTKRVPIRNQKFEYIFFRNYNLSAISKNNIHRFRSGDFIYIYDEGINSYKIRRSSDEIDYFRNPIDYGSFTSILINQIICFTILEINTSEVVNILFREGLSYIEYKIIFSHGSSQKSSSDITDITLTYKLNYSEELIGFIRNERRTGQDWWVLTEFDLSLETDIVFNIPEFENFFEINQESYVFNPTIFEFTYTFNLIFTGWNSWMEGNHFVVGDFLYVISDNRFFAYNLITFELEAIIGLPLASSIKSFCDDYLYLIPNISFYVSSQVPLGKDILVTINRGTHATGFFESSEQLGTLLGSDNSLVNGKEVITDMSMLLLYGLPFRIFNYNPNAPSYRRSMGRHFSQEVIEHQGFFYIFHSPIDDSAGLYEVNPQTHAFRRLTNVAGSGLIAGEGKIMWFYRTWQEPWIYYLFDTTTNSLRSVPLLLPSDATDFVPFNRHITPLAIKNSFVYFTYRTQAGHYNIIKHSLYDDTAELHLTEGELCWFVQ